MKRRTILIAATALAVLVAGVAAAPRAERKGLFAPLEPGQQVGLKEGPGGYTITVVPGVPLGQKVVEVGADHVVLEDPTGVTQTRIPVTAVRVVVVTRLPKDR